MLQQNEFMEKKFGDNEEVTVDANKLQNILRELNKSQSIIEELRYKIDLLEAKIALCELEKPIKVKLEAKQIDAVQDEVADLIDQNESLTYENRKMAEALEALGFTEEEISGICSGALSIEEAPDEDELEKFECPNCGCYFMVEDRDDFDCPNCEFLRAEQKRQCRK